jgi:sugar lactone lactonase YvrE
LVLGDLDHPSGVAIQPETGHVFISDTGRGRVVRWVEGQLQPVVVRFPSADTGQDVGGRPGPLGLIFLDNQTLAIGVGGASGERASVRVVRIPPPGSDPISADSAIRLDSADDTVAGVVEGACYSLAKTKLKTIDALLATGGDVSQAGWLAVIPLLKPDQLAAAESYGRLTRLLPANSGDALHGPRGISIGPYGELVVGQMGEIGEQADGRLTIYRMSDGKRLLDLPTGLYDVAAIAYGKPLAPSNKRRLYALDFATSRPDAAGLFRLDAQWRDGQIGVQATRISTLPHPTAMAFAPDGTLYVCQFGVARDGDPQPSGQLVRFAPGL